MKYVILFLSMVFLHIFDDYVLQNALARLKQKSTWEEYVKETPIYKNDYKMALFEHALEWTLVVHSPFMIYAYIHNIDGIGKIAALITSVIFNTAVHYITDDAKANAKKINLIQDQLIHFMQVIVIFLLFF